MENKFFDLHFHPLFKQFISKYESVYPSGRPPEELLKEIDLKNFVTDFADTQILHILESQSCPEQMDKGGLRLGVAAISTVEKFFTNPNSLFGKVLNSRFWTKPLDQRYMDKIRDGEISYYHLFLKELELYKKLQKNNRIAFATRHTQVTIDPEKIILAISMEGGHCLCRTLAGKPSQTENLSNIKNADALYTDFREHKSLSAAASLQHLQQAMWQEGMDLFHLTLTHLSHIREQFLATHAYGMKLLKDDSVYPIGNGLSYKGKEVIDAAYTLKVKVKGKEVDAPVLIDIKHMSLKSRIDFYKYRNEKDYRLPILATHMGVTGYSIAGWKEALTEKVLVKGAVPVVRVTAERKLAGQWGLINKKNTFNAWTINLMDEDIIEIMRSGGLIGVIMDVRILGWQWMPGKGDKEEFITLEDFKYFFPNESLGHAEELKGARVDAEESWIKPTKEERNHLAFCFNILHIVSVTKIYHEKIDPWKHICLGSDFDGLIEPLKSCREASMLSELSQQTIRWMPTAEKAYLEENGGPALLKRDTNGEADLEDLRLKIQDIMYHNGKNFLENWMNGQLTTTAHKQQQEHEAQV